VLYPPKKESRVGQRPGLRGGTTSHGGNPKKESSISTSVTSGSSRRDIEPKDGGTPRSVRVKDNLDSRPCSSSPKSLSLFILEEGDDKAWGRP